MVKVHTRKLGNVAVVSVQGRIVNGETASLREEVDAANERGHGCAPAGPQGLNHGIRHNVADIRDTAEVALLEAGRRDRRDRDGGGLQFL